MKEGIGGYIISLSLYYAKLKTPEKDHGEHRFGKHSVVIPSTNAPNSIVKPYNMLPETISPLAVRIVSTPGTSGFRP